MARKEKPYKPYRIWVHPRGGGDDYFYEYDTLSQATHGRIVHAHEGHIEPILKFEGGRERPTNIFDA